MVVQILANFMRSWAISAEDLFAKDALYVLIGVSGTLQDGFPLRDRLDFVDPFEKSREVPAMFIGKALVRGYKAYLDIKRPGCREYIAQPEPPHIPNAVVMPSGCSQHANLYWIYAVDQRQVLQILAGEPRYLSISPDTGLVDLTADLTDETVKLLSWNQIQAQGKADMTRVAIPLVTGVWFDPRAFVETPTVTVLPDGTHVTSFDEGLALWAGASHSDLVSVDNDLTPEEQECGVQNDSNGSVTCQEYDQARREAWGAVYKAIRAAESKTEKVTSTTCLEEGVRFGVSSDQARINYPLTKSQLLSILPHLSKQSSTN